MDRIDSARRTVAVKRLRGLGADLRNQAQLLLGQVGFAQSSSQLTRDAESYWSGIRDDRWFNDSHWRSGSVFATDDRWATVGREHLALYQRLRRTLEDPPTLDRIIEWGCGGGANAVQFAPLSKEFIGVEIVADSLDECERQVAQVCSTHFVKVLAEVSDPEHAAQLVDRPCDLFLCLYVLELVPTQEYGLRLMRIAYDLLGPRGMAFAQIKYSTRSWRTRSRQRDYRSAVAGTTFRIDEFWNAMQDIGFRPEAVALVPRNDLDERYAYFLLSKP